MWDDYNLHDYFLVYHDYALGDVLTIKDVSVGKKKKSILSSQV